jgi:ABC-2 type transport system permease protein
MSYESVPPAWQPATRIRGFARHQPVTPVIDTFRGLLLHIPTGNAPLEAAIWCAGLLTASIGLAAALFRRRTAGRTNLLRH